MLSDSKCNKFASFFSEKINNIRKPIGASSSFAEVTQIRPQFQKEVTMSVFEAIDSKILEQIVQHLKSSTCYLVWDSTTMQARMPPAWIESILTAVARVRGGQSLTVKQVQRPLGLMAAASNVIPLGLLYMRPLQGWLKTRRFFLRGNPLRMIKVTRRCLRALDMWRQPWFLSQGPVLGAPCRRVALVTDASLTGWGADILLRQGPRPGEWMLHPEVVKQIWRVFGQAQVDLFSTQETAQCPLWYSLIHPAPLGLDAMVQTWPRLHLYVFSPIALLPGVLTRVRRDEVRLPLVAPFWPGRIWFSDLISLPDGSPWEIPVRRDLLSQAGVYHPRPEMWKSWGWPLRGCNS